jgi:Sulfotransferase family.
MNASNETHGNISTKTVSQQTRRLEFVHITKTGGSAIEKAGAKAGIIWGACHYMNITEVGCERPDIPYIAPDYQSYALTSPWHTPPKLLRIYVNESQYPYDNADLFAVIRNPYDRVLSEYYCPWLGFQAKYRKNIKHDKDPNDPAIMNQWVQTMIGNLEEAMDEFKSQQSDSLTMRNDAKPKVQRKGVNEDRFILAQKHYVNQAEYVYDEDRMVIENVVHYENLSKEFQELMDKYGIQTSLPPKHKGGIYTDTENKKRLTFRHLDSKSIQMINNFAKPDFEKFGYEMVHDKFHDDYSLEAKQQK